MFLNNAYLCGTVVSEPVFSNGIHGQRFFKFPFSIVRQSGQVDTIAIMADEELLTPLLPMTGQRLAVSGKVRTFNTGKDSWPRTEVFVFATKLEPTADPDDNKVEVYGTLTKDPVRRYTPLGRLVCDLVIAAPRPYGKQDYVPCIAWGENANKIGCMQARQEIEVVGRMQSRTYNKSVDGVIQERTAYELSISQIR